MLSCEYTSLCLMSTWKLQTEIRWMNVSLSLLYSKGGDLEEELKNVTNTLKSLEAQSEKVILVMCLCVCTRVAGSIT